MKNKCINIFHCLFLVFVVGICVGRKWSVENLVENVKEWNYLNDPEELISDKKLGPKIHTSYLTINYVYEKTDINLFYLSDIVEKYIYKKRQFVEDLYHAMLNSTEINKAGMKKHHLFVVIFKKLNEIIIYGSSPELQKLLPADKVLTIEMEIKKAMKSKKNSPAAIVYLVFEKLQKLWKKHTITKSTGYKTGKQKKKDFSFVKDSIYFIVSLGILSLFGYTLCCRKKGKSKGD